MDSRTDGHGETKTRGHYRTDMGWTLGRALDMGHLIAVFSLS